MLRCALVLACLIGTLPILGCTYPDVQLIDGDGGGDAGPNPLAPQVTVLFPPQFSVTDEELIVVRGSASDPDGIAAVRVDGLPVTSDDGFATWQIELPLNVGVNVLVVSSEDALGNESASAAQVSVNRSPARLSSTLAIANDSERGRVIVADFDALIAVELATGARTLISGQGRGIGPDLGFPRGLAVDSVQGVAWITTSNTQIPVLEIDLLSGDRRALAGTGTQINDPVGLAFDRQNGRLLVTDRILEAVVAIDLVTEQRTIFVQGEDDGAPLITPVDIAIDENRGLAVIVDENQRALLSVDLNDREVNRLSDASQGMGPDFAVPLGVSIDTMRNRALVADLDLRAVVEVSLTNGDRTILSDLSIGDGPMLRAPFAISAGFDPAGGSFIVVADNELANVIRIDPDDGARTIVSDLNAGSGIDLFGPGAAEYDSGGQRILVVDSPRGALLAIDRTSGERRVISGPGVGSGPSLIRPTDVALDTRTGTALVTDAGQVALIEIDLTSGVRTILSDNSNGMSAPMEEPIGVAIHSDDERIWVVDRGTASLLAIARDGTRTLASGPGRGDGKSMIAPVSVAVDAIRDRVLVCDSTRQAIIAIDVISGDRTTVPVGTAEPVSIRIDEATNRFLFVDRLAATLFAADLDESVPADGLASSSDGAGPGLGRPTGVAWDPATGSAFIVNGASLLMVDAVTKQRAVFSGYL
ncbi:MAG: hypothetical protein AAGC55_02245 [Myxococcota bacterium]